MSFGRRLAPPRALNPCTGAFFKTRTCAVCRAIFPGGTVLCASCQLTLPRDTTILHTSNLCPSWGPPCGPFSPIFPGTQFSPKFEEMGPCAGQGGDPLPPARRDCAVHTGAPPPTPPARARGRNAQQTAPRTSSCSTRVHVARFVPRFSRAKTPSASQTLVFKARGRSQKARKTHMGQTHVSSRRHLAPRRALNPCTGAFFKTPTCAVFRAIFPGGTVLCASG